MLRKDAILTLLVTSSTVSIVSDIGAEAALKAAGCLPAERQGKVRARRSEDAATAGWSGRPGWW